MKSMSKIGIDPKCVELAEYFVESVRITASFSEDVTELAEAIQTLCEDFCRSIEEDDGAQP